MSNLKENRQHPALKGVKTTIVGIFINTFLAIIKWLAGIFGNSYAMIADAIESTSDIFSSIIVLVGLKIASKPPDKEHPYGHGKAEPIAAMVVSLALFGASIIVAMQSIEEIRNPSSPPKAFTLLVLSIVIVSKEFLYRYVFKVGHEVSSTVVKTDAWHHRSDAITSAAAFIGISVSLIGGEGYEAADDWAALMASAIIAYNAFLLIKPALNEVMDTAPPPYIIEEVKQIAAQVDGVVDLEKCFVRKMGFEYYVDLHVRVNANLTVKEGHDIAHEVKKAINNFNPQVSNVLIHIEPA